MYSIPTLYDDSVEIWERTKLSTELKLWVSTWGGLKQGDTLEDAETIGVPTFLTKGQNVIRPYVHHPETRKLLRVNLPREMAVTFLPNPMNYKRVKSRDGNPCNLKISNLVWSPSGNKGTTTTKKTRPHATNGYNYGYVEHLVEQRLELHKMLRGEVSADGHKSKS